MRGFRAKASIVFAVALCAAAGCDSDDDDRPPGSGGSSGAGGTSVGGTGAGGETGIAGTLSGQGGEGATGGTTSGGASGTGGTSVGGVGGTAGTAGTEAGHAGEGGEVTEAGAAGVPGAGGTVAVGGTTGVGGTTVAGGSAGVGGTSEVGGTAGIAGTSGVGGTGGAACAGVDCSTHGSCAVVEGAPSCVCDSGYVQGAGAPTTCVDVDECSANNGGCDALTTCTNLPGSRSCSACPPGYSGTGETGCTTLPCDGAPGASCACLEVSLDGDDALAAASDGGSPFANVQTALDYAAAHPHAPRAVCVAEGATCGTTATYAGPAGADLTMRDGVSLYGKYESATWSRCDTGSTTLAPGSGSGVYFGPSLTSTTVLDGFTLARFSAATSTAITVDGARGVVVSNVDLGNAPAGATTTYGIDAKNGGDARLDEIVMTTTADAIPANQTAIRAIGAHVVVTHSTLSLFAGYPQAQNVTGLRLDQAPGSAVTDSSVVLYSGAPTIGIYASDSAGLKLDGTHLEIHAAGDGAGAPTIVAAADFMGVPDLSWQSGTLVAPTASATATAFERGISLSDSPRAKVAVDVNVGMTFIQAIYLEGDASGTELGGSVTGSGSAADTAMVLNDCNGTAPLVRTSVSVTGSTSGGNAIRVAGDCAPTISASANVTIYPGSVAPPGVGLQQTLRAIHCMWPSRCTIDHARATVTGGNTPYGSVIQSYGIDCEPGACPTIVDSTASALSQVGEQHTANYAGGGINAPGATLVARNVVYGRCTGADGFGLAASGRIENNVITGADCGATAITQYSKSVGLRVIGDAVVHSNEIHAGGADDCGFSCTGGSQHLGCLATGILDGSGRYLNNIVGAGGCLRNVALWLAAEPAPNSNALLHNDLAGNVLVAIGPFVLPTPAGTYLTTVDEVNGLAGASGNFSGGSVIDAGTSIEAPLTDINGVPRDQNPDVGPYEATGEPSPCRDFSCSEHGVCRIENDAALCACDPHYAGDHCEIVDPCETGNGGCDPLTSCTATSGGPICGPCPAGYTGDGVSGCVDVDECQSANGGCDPLVTCTNTGGGRTCGSCPPGYAGNGEDGCYWSPLCSPNPCEHGGTCADLDGTCTCPSHNPGPHCEHYPTELALGDFHMCTLDDVGAISCWGSDNSYGQTNAPSGTFTHVLAGKQYSCGLASDGTITCWGNMTTPASGTFESFAGGDYHVCAVGTDHVVQCFTTNNFFGQASPPTGTFSTLDAAFNRTCGIRTDGTIACWGSSDGVGVPPSGTFTSLALGNYHGCAIAEDQTLHCWGNNAFGQATPPTGTFEQVTAAGDFTCGIRTDKTLACWGDHSTAELAPPSGTFTTLDAYRSTNIGRACAIDTSQQLTCWGDYQVAGGF